MDNSRLNENQIYKVKFNLSSLYDNICEGDKLHFIKETYSPYDNATIYTFKNFNDKVINICLQGDKVSILDYLEPL